MATEFQDMTGFQWPEEHRPGVQHNDYDRDPELPVIDMAELQDETSRLKVGNQIVAACSDWGFFHLVNHGVPVAALDELHQQAERFFALPMDVKQRASPPSEKFDLFGYGYKAGSVNYKVKGRPWNETFRSSWSPAVSNIGEHARDAFMERRGDLHEFESAVESFCVRSESVAKCILELCALGFGMAPEVFCEIVANRSRSSLNNVRLNYYPPCPTPDRTLGLGAHTDFYVLSLLHQCQVGGLQICRDGKWITVKPRRGALIVNVGDCLQAWTNGRFKSVQHRAVLNAKVSRISVGFFYTPASFDTTISAPDAIVRADGRRYKSFTYAEYLDFVKHNFKARENDDGSTTPLQSFALN